MRELQFEIILNKISESKFQAICPTLPGCFSEGKTKKEALVKIEKAIIDYIEMALDWTASGMMMLKVFDDGAREVPTNNLAPRVFPMDVELHEGADPERNLFGPTGPPPNKGVLGIPFGFN